MQYNTNGAVRAVMLLPRYILMLAVFIFIGELSYMVFYGTTQLMAGSRIVLFDGNALLRGFTVVIPVAVVCSGAMLGVHRVRHYGGGWLSILSYIVLGAVTWFLFFPVSLGVIAKIDTMEIDTDVKKHGAPKLTGGYFREYGRDTVYFPHDFVTKEQIAVFINGYEDANDAVSIKVISRQQMIDDAAPFKDILVKNTVPSVAKWITDGFEHFTKRAMAAKSGGPVSWLSFASLGIVLFAVYALSFCSRWRLMGVVIMLSMYAGVLGFNLLYFSPMLDSMLALSLAMPFGGSETLLTCINLSLAVLFVLLGTLSVLIRRRLYS